MRAKRPHRDEKFDVAHRYSRGRLPIVSIAGTTTHEHDEPSDCLRRGLRRQNAARRSSLVCPCCCVLGRHESCVAWYRRRTTGSAVLFEGPLICTALPLAAVPIWLRDAAAERLKLGFAWLVARGIKGQPVDMGWKPVAEHQEAGSNVREEASTILWKIKRPTAQTPVSLF